MDNKIRKALLLPDEREAKRVRSSVDEADADVVKRGRPPKKDETQHRVNLKDELSEVSSKVDQIEPQVSEVLRLRKNAFSKDPLGISVIDEDREKALVAIKKRRSLEVSRRQQANAKRSADLMRQFANILRQIIAHKWAWPFLQPVDVRGLNLHDYFQIIKKPMDFGTIRDRMDAKDGNAYKSIQEVAEDTRLVFSNAMTYNAVGSDVYVMARTLSEKFEEKWKTALEPKLQEEAIRRKQEQAEMEIHETEEIKAAEDAALDRMSLEICNQLLELENELDDLKTQATAKCRTMTIEEKRQLGQSLGRLPTANLTRVVQIIAKKNPGFNTGADEVEVEIDALDTGTLWQLHCYVQMVLNQQKQFKAQK